MFVLLCTSCEHTIIATRRRALKPGARNDSDQINRDVWYVYLVIESARACARSVFLFRSKASFVYKHAHYCILAVYGGFLFGWGRSRQVSKVSGWSSDRRKSLLCVVPRRLLLDFGRPEACAVCNFRWWTRRAVSRMLLQGSTPLTCTSGCTKSLSRTVHQELSRKSRSLQQSI